MIETWVAWAKGPVFMFAFSFMLLGLLRHVALTILETVRAIITISDAPEIEPVILGEAPNEIQAHYLSSAKAQRLLGWEPAYTFKEGLSETLAWYKEFLNKTCNH